MEESSAAPFLDRRNIGLEFINGVATLRVWAPLATLVNYSDVTSGKMIPLEKQSRHYWFLESTEIQPGAVYRLIIDEQPLPDPASVYQPDGVHGPSMALDLKDFQWHDQTWTNLPLSDYIIYEMHTGLLTQEGTFDSAISRLDHVVKLGVTAIEIMPVAQFAGSRNWGYDGVFPFSVQNSYGGPQALMRFVNACHARGLAVILDAVYNHLGPEGNYMSQSGPWFTNKYNTPWGSALNFDDAYSDGVREYFVANALMWFRDFHIDALRLDAVHAIKDLSTIHILAELRSRTLELRQATGKIHHLIIECDLNDPKYLETFSGGGYDMDAQWSDEFHHALRVSAGLEPLGYYEDFAPVSDLARALINAYVYTGQYSTHRKRKFGKAPQGMSGSRFIVFSQNHDQVGNRMLGERSVVLHGFELAKVLAAAVLLSPFIPLLFMGEEYGETRPFQYFVGHGDPELNRLVREGRAADFEAFHHEAETPDPVNEETYERSRPSFEVKGGRAEGIFTFYQRLINLRKTEAALRCGAINTEIIQAQPGSDFIWFTRSAEQEVLHCILNFSQEQPVVVNYNLGDQATGVLIDSASAQWGGPGSMEVLEGKVHVAPSSALIFKETHP